MGKHMPKTFHLILLEVIQQLQFPLQQVTPSILQANHSRLSDVGAKTLLQQVLSYIMFI